MSHKPATAIFLLTCGRSSSNFNRMGNLATLQPAPPFTRENASEMGKRGNIASAETKRRNITAQNEISAKPQIEPEIHRIVKAMKRIQVTSEDYKELAAILDKLWNKAFPTQGAVKSRQTRSAAPILTPRTPQENVREIKDISENDCVIET